MPDVTAFYKFKMKLRRWPALHRPLQKARQLLTEKIPKTAVDLWRAMTPRSSFRLGPPKDTISIYQSLLYENMRPKRIVLTDQGAPELSSDSLMVVSGLRQHLCQPWPIFWSYHKNARLVSSSLALLDERKRLCRESVYNDMCAESDPAWNYFTLPKPTMLKGNWTSIVSRWCANTGAAPFSHWIMDALPRLALLKEFPADTQIIVPSRLAGYQKEMLKMLGLLDRVRPTPEQHVIAENYYFSSPASMIGCNNPYGVKWLRDTFLPLADKSYRAPKRFIIQRTGKSRGITNETEVNAYFQKLGWAIIDTEKLTFAQELQLFSNAEAIAGILGSGFTNCIWSPPGCKVITFVADNWIDGWVEWICKANNLDYQWKLFPADHAMMTTVSLPGIEEMLAKANLL